MTAAVVTRFEIARAIPTGSRRARGQRDWLRAVQAEPELAGLRPAFADRLVDVAQILARYSSWGDRTTRPGRALVCKQAGIGVTTWKRIRKRLEAWGYLGTVRQGTTPEFSSFLHRGEDNEAAVYVLAIPRRKRMTAQLAGSPRTGGPPTQPARAVVKAPARGAASQTRDRPACGRAQPRSASAPGGATAPSGAGLADAMAAAIRRAGGKTITDGWCGWLARPFAAAGYSAADLAWAIDHDWAGAQHRWTGRIRHPVGWIHKRLELWLDPGGKPRPSRSQQLQASRDRIARERGHHVTFIQRATDILRASHEEDRARLRALPGDLGQRGGALARELLSERRQPGRTQPNERSRRMDIFDSVSPSKLPVHATHVCLYHDGEFAARTEQAEVFAAVRWITVIGDYDNCGIADYEQGNPIFSQNDALRAWVQGRLDNHHRARVYCDRNNLPEVRDQLDGVDGWELWVATLDGDILSEDWAPNLWAVQYAGGPTSPYDTSILYGEW